MLQYQDFNHKGVLIEIGDVPDTLTDIRANAPFEWQDTADDRFVFVCIERKIAEVFDVTGKLASNNIRIAYIGQEVNEEFFLSCVICLMWNLTQKMIAWYMNLGGVPTWRTD